MMGSAPNSPRSDRSMDAPGRILVVEDQPLDRDLLRRVLEGAGHEVVAVGSAREALQEVEQRLPEVILCDVSMPEMDGLEFCRTVKQRLGDELVPVLFVTALTRPEHLLAGYRAGAEDYIEKPFDFDELLARVRTMLRIRRLHRSLREYAARLKDAQEETEELLHIVSHDLKAPLLSIVALLRDLKNALAGSRHVQASPPELVDQITAVATHAVALVEQLSNYGRLGRAAFRPMQVDMGVVVQQALKNLESVLEGASPALDMPPDWPTLEVAPLEICQVWQNLIDNAVKYADPKRPLRIELGWEQEAGAGKGGYRFWVSDTGRGIPPERQKDVFRLFSRASAEVPGFGVGLAAAARIVARHGGEIGLESTPGEGTTVWFTLPAMTRGDAE